MTFSEATEIAALSQELFPKTSDQLAAVLRDLVAPFPDEKYARSLLRRLATETTILPMPMIRAELANELRRRGETSQDYARQQERIADRDAVRKRQKVDALIETLGDDDLEALKPQALEYLRRQGNLTDDALSMLSKLRPRKSGLVKAAIYEIVKPAVA